MQYIKHRKYANVELFRFGYSPIGKPWLSVYCYVIDDVLIDTAQANCEELVLETFKSKSIQRILLTHWHEDHSGNLAQLATQHHSQVYSHDFTKEKLREGFAILPYEKFLFGKITPYKGSIAEFPEVIETAHHRLIPIFTPGHSEDHTVFLEKERGWLFSGDLFVGVKIKIFRKGEKFWEQVESFKKVLTHDFDVLFCGHHPRLKDGKQMLQAKLQYFEDFGGNVQELHQKGFSTKEIIKAMKLRENRLVRLLLSNDVSVKYMVEAAINKP